ncbi:uncharacterized protein [Rutidosis leptorrhynchoides]|uniref:uncharacterized protein n=1 Tax=Rutidosis leptorrhynchoides TaxID=125765 RepID=UPI003A9A3F81
MTFKDFFTLTELKDGLTSPSRVTELFNIMQNEKETLNNNNNNESTRQWSAVATAIAATENKECLDLFIQLDGLTFINKWLNDAQKFENDSENDDLEQLIVALLCVIEKLHVDPHWSPDSGIGKTVSNLCSHRSSLVQAKAKAICNKQTPSENNNENKENVEQVTDQKMMSACSDDDVQKEINKEEIVIMPTQEIVLESATDIIKAEKDEPKSENTPLTEVSSALEDAKEEQKVNSLEHKTLTLSTDVDHALEPATKTEIMEDTNDKDEEMVEGDESHTIEVDIASGIGDSTAGGLPEMSGTENPKTASDTENDEDEKKDVEMESDEDSGYRSSTPSVKVRDNDLISNRPSDMELDCGMVDPLELARQVAIEVECEVSSQEQSCSTSTGGLGNEVSSGPGPGPGPGSSSPAEPDIPATEMGQESGLNAEKGFSGFDLNQEFSSEETESAVDPVMTQISVVSASRAAAADGLPVAPLQFEGTLGWKGSAATSAFRRVPDSEKTFSSSSSHNNSNLLDFDLNVADACEDNNNNNKMEDFLSRDKIKENSRLQLDLNSLGDGDVGPISLDWKRDNRVTTLRQNGPLSPSVSSSSSSFRNIDLNLNDHFTGPNNASLDNPFLGKLFNNKRDEPVISIFGTQVRKDYIPPPARPNGRILEPSVDFSLGRPGPGSSLSLGSSMPYPNLPGYGYGHNGYAMGPMYPPPGAPIPYMVDSRGAHMLPSIPPPASFSQQTQPFFFNMGGPSGSNGAGTSRSNFDLNSGFLTEMGNRENNGGLRQFFNHNQASSSSVIGGKREEPDSGWEFFPINYKHQQPPWQ